MASKTLNVLAFIVMSGINSCSQTSDSRSATNPKESNQIVDLSHPIADKVNSDTISLKEFICKVETINKTMVRNCDTMLIDTDFVYELIKVTNTIELFNHVNIRSHHANSDSIGAISEFNQLFKSCNTLDKLIDKYSPIVDLTSHSLLFPILDGIMMYPTIATELGSIYFIR
jgi:hypothetical protein